jgi:hypothetical protein
MDFIQPSLVLSNYRLELHIRGVGRESKMSHRKKCIFGKCIKGPINLTDSLDMQSRLKLQSKQS